MIWIMIGLLWGGAIALAFCAVYAKLKMAKYPLERYARRTLICAAATILFYGIGMTPWNCTVSLWAFTFYNIFETATCVTLLSFMIKYVDQNNGMGVFRMPILALSGADLLLMISNPFTNWAFSLDTYLSQSGTFFHRINENLYVYALHSCFMLVLAALTTAKLVQKIIDAPVSYIIKYCPIFLTIVTIMGVSTFYVFGQLVFDYSVLLYPLVGAFIFYYSLIYVPKGLLERIMFFTVASMKDGIICLDIDNKVVHANTAATKFSLADPDVDQMETQVVRWMRENVKEGESMKKWDITRRIDGEKHYFSIEYHRIFDGSVKSIGCFFLIHDRTEEHIKIKNEIFKATHDQLTGLYNKEHFYELVREELDNHPADDYYIVVTDVKNFKLINDVFGVNEGDRLLKRIADITAHYGGSNCIYARLTGDRFAMCIHKSRFSEAVLLSSFAAIQNFFGNSNFKTHIHIGIYEVTDRELRVSVMCDRANIALRTIKNSFRCFVAYYKNELRETFISEHKIVSEFEKAIEEHQFQVYIQPQVSINGSIFGGEALVRWIHPTEGIVPPGKFIKILEQTGLICRLDRYMWEEACRQLKKWDEMGLKNSYISINISQKDFYLLDVYDIITKLTQKYKVAPQRLHLEITETALMDDPEEHLKLISRLRRYGFLVEIDDFGSGYSSLNMLKELDADVLKIDMGFLQETAHPERSHMILKMIITLAKTLSMEVITEGVENKDQVVFLTEYGCDIFQGYYFAKPVPVEQFEANYLNKRFRMDPNAQQ